MKKKIKKTGKCKDIIIRALKTFMQAFLASFLLSTNNLSNLDKTTLKSAFIGALAGGISACMNLIVNLFNKGGK